MDAEERNEFAETQREMVLSRMELFFMSLYKELATIAEKCFFLNEEEEWQELRLAVGDHLIELTERLLGEMEEL